MSVTLSSRKRTQFSLLRDPSSTGVVSAESHEQARPRLLAALEL